MRIVQIASEIAPFSKSGGLADVVGALSEALVAAGHEVWTVSPRYRGVASGAVPTEITVSPSLGGRPQPARLLHLEGPGVQHLFVDHRAFDRDGLYGDLHGTFGDNHMRFALLCQAALAAAHHLVGPHAVLHAHDWQAALLPIYLEAAWRPLGLLPHTTTVLTLHNPMHQGRLGAAAFADLELPARWFSPWGLELHGDLCLLKGGILHAQQLTTVSPTFAREILTPGGGFGLEGVLAGRATDLIGILNGLDTHTWDPQADPHLPAAFSATDLSGKAVCKSELQAGLGLPVDPSAPLVASVGRLDPQKGVELLADSIPWLVQQGAQVVALGSAAAAHRHLEHRLATLEEAHPHHVRAWIGYSEALAHTIQAAADLFVMPSLFEPCGLTQMSAMRYGTVPVVRRTGGLADSVTPFMPGDPAEDREDSGTGFLFGPPTGRALRDALWRALSLYHTDPKAFQRLQVRGMSTDLSWKTAAAAYVEVYAQAKALRAR
ncbi:MAG TPA: glycogen synthase [Deltaproteobacteria bacterium]|nr:glycogen synthase [Deltaproteobacteria bacterium]